MRETTSNKCYAILLYDELFEYEEEIAKLSKVIANDPSNLYAWHNRGIAYREIGEIEAARRDLSKAASLSNTEYLPHQMLGEFLHGLGETDAAIAAYKIGLQIFPNNPPLNRKLGLLYKRESQYELALKYIDRAILNHDTYIYLESERSEILKALKYPKRTKIIQILQKLFPRKQSR